MTNEWRDRFSSGMQGAVQAAGSTTAVVLAVLLVVGWMIVGLVNGFTDTWFTVLHSVAGVTAFVMVFLIRHAEGREARATLLKLDELVAATQGASDRVIGVETEALNLQESVEEDVPHTGTATQAADTSDKPGQD